MSTKKNGDSKTQNKVNGTATLEQTKGKGTPSEAPLKPVKDEKGQKPEPAKEKKQEPAKPAGLAVGTVNDRIERHAKMQKLVERHAHLKAKDEELDNFMTTNDGNSTLTLETQDGDQVQVTNNVVIDSALKSLRGQLDELLDECEQSLLEFQV